jgi:hypothetical protein
MAEVALLPQGSVGRRSLPQFPVERKLGMGIVAFDAPVILTRFFDPELTVEARFQPLRDVIVAGEALPGLKKILQVPAHILGVGVKIPICDVIVAVQAGGLPVDGDMVLFFIDQP